MDVLFPYETMRAEQDNLVADIISCIKNKKNMLIHAPTGIGKTAAVLGPALKYALDSQKTIFFITSKHTQHKIAIETISQIKNKFKIKINAADFIGKRHMCLISNVNELNNSEFYDFCRDSIEKGTCQFYSNLEDKNNVSTAAKFVLETMKESIMPVEEVIKLCSKHELCPHEITLLHAQESDVIIADYFHILSPSIRDSLLKKAKKEITNSFVIIDEGHNLPDRCRDLLSSQLSTYALEKAAKEVSFFGDEETASKIAKMKDILTSLSSKLSIADSERLVKKDEFTNEVNSMIDYDDFLDTLNEISDEILLERKRSYARQVASFLKSWPGPDEGFARILKRGYTKQNKINITLNYRCLDPSIIMSKLAKESNIIIMSGTLSPTSIYRDLFGFESELKEYNDPFPKSNRLNLIIPDITTKFTSRDQEMYQKIASTTASIVNSVPGNSIVFFPSYSLIDSIYPYFRAPCDKSIFMERPRLTKQDKETIIENFKKYKSTGAVLLACASGSFGESIDLPGDYLKAVLVVGLPLAKPDLEVKETINYYQKKFGNGWDYGYIFPALITCIQNAGRCIRSETDRGIIVFLDSRYCLDKYKKFFPKNWDIKVTKEPIQLIKEFFSNS